MKIIRINDRNGHLLNKLNRKNNGTVLFYHPHCHHCNMMKPEWENVKEQLLRRKKKCNLFEVNGEHMDSIHHPMKSVVSGFPTILNVNNGKISHFEKERNVANMIQFILSNLKKNTSNSLKAKNYTKNKKLRFKLNNGNLLKTKKVLNAKLLPNNLNLNRKRLNKTKKNNKKKRKGKGKK